jgi:hypothetical protein
MCGKQGMDTLLEHDKNDEGDNNIDLHFTSLMFWV